MYEPVPGTCRSDGTHVQADQVPVVAAGALQSHQPQQAAAVRHTRQAGLLAADIRAPVSGGLGGGVRGGGGLYLGGVDCVHHWYWLGHLVVSTIGLAIGAPNYAA